MKKTLRAIAIGVLGLGTVAVVAGQSAAEPRCHRVHYPARVHADHFSGPECTSPFGACTKGEFLGDPLLQGTTFAITDGLAPAAGMPDVESPTTTFSFHTVYTITTDRGSITLNDTGVIDVAAVAPDGRQGLFAERKVVLGGTGQFAGATGFLFFTGQGLGPFDADVTGEICLQN